MKLLTLEEWAALKFSKPPCLNTLRAWARQGMIQPQPVKIGRQYRVDPEAEHADLIYDTSDLNDREKGILYGSQAA